MYVVLSLTGGYSLDSESFPYDVVVSRDEGEGFGFVIISSLNKTGSVIGNSSVSLVVFINNSLLIGCFY